MSSPQKRNGDALNAALKTTPNKASEFPPIRSRSPKKVASKSKRRSDDASKNSTLPRVGTMVSYAQNGDHLPQVLESGEELEVLKCVLVREGYLQRLAHASAQNKVSGSHLSETIDVLDLLRVATIDVVEAIVTWRIKQQKLQPHAPLQPSDVPVFTWNSINYLLKVASDLDFLDKHQGLIQWLGFTLLRNPFILPVTLGTRQQLDRSEIDIGVPQASPGRCRREGSSSQFVQVGGKRVVVDQGHEAVSALRAAQAAALAERKRAKNPYETRVLNDEELVPLSRATGAALVRPGSRTAGSSSIELPSQIGELDMTRIRVCERVVLQEEATHGCYTRDLKGQLVPESEAIRRRNMVEMSGDAYAHMINASETDGTRDDEGSVMNAREPRAGLPAEAHAKKRAGMLGSISKPQQRKPVRKAPNDRSRGAQLEESLQRERKANYALGVSIDRIREEIERKEMDLAYFESFPGVQLYGNELDDFQRKTRAEVALLRRDVAEKDYVYKSRMANLDRKEEIIHMFKSNRKSAVDAERHVRLETQEVPQTTIQPNQETETPSSARESDPSPPQLEPRSAVETSRSTGGASTTAAYSGYGNIQPIVHDMCATLIQKIARGKLARAAYEELKIEYYVGSKYIQAVVRGFLARRRVAKLYWQLTASVILQRFARGMLARRFAARRRQARAMLQAAIRIQRTVRGHFGRRRMKRVRRLFEGRKELLVSADALNLSDLRELADACMKMVAVRTSHAKTPQLPSLVLGLVRVVMMFTTDHDDDVCVSAVRWREAAHFLRCSSRLQRRLGKIAGISATGDRHLRSSLLGAALLDMYTRDKDFNESTFANLESGWRAAMVLYRWVKAFDTVCQEQSVLETKDTARSCMRPFLFSEATTAVEAMQERVEEQEHSIAHGALERRFVPQDLVESAKARTRAMLVVVAFDVPATTRQSVLNQLQNALPGVFIVMNRREATAQTDEGSGRRISKAQKQQLEILGVDYTSIRESLAAGHSVILDCDIGLTDAQQRRFVGAFTALKASIKPSPLCLMVRGSLLNRPVPDENLSTLPPMARSQSRQRVMADADIKQAFQQSADWLCRLSHPASAKEMVLASGSESSSPSISMAFVLVMEAVVILLTPTKRYDAPQVHASGVSWKLARRLLANPSFLMGKLATVQYGAISQDNLRTLSAYVTHSDWPTPTLTHGSSGGLLHALASWVNSVVMCARMALDRHGLAPSISRSTPVPGLFDNVVVFRNVGSGDGALVAYQELLDGALADVRVYRKVHMLEARRCVLSVYHDCQRYFFCAYDPVTSWRWQRIVGEEEIDTLLAPNSIERGEDAAIKRQPPRTPDEMYDRLVRLCLLTPAATEPKRMRGSEAAVGLCPETKQLIVRPPAIRLFRRVVRLGGHRTTITLAELSRGRIQVDVAVHDLSLALRRVVNLEQILERLSHRASHTVFIPPERLPALVLERLHVYRRTPSSATLVAPEDALQLGVCTKETAPGRVVLRKAIKSWWLPAERGRASVWLFTVTEHHHDDRFQVEIYQPQSSERFSRAISKREFQDLQLPDLCQHPSSTTASELLRRVIKLLQFEKDLDDDDEDAPIRSCTLRHHMLVRFPLAIRFVVSPHHVVEKSGVVRAYVQVETKEVAQHEGARLRICFPERCEEQALEWLDAEIDSFFASHGVSWTTALRAERQRLAYELAQSVLRWDATTQRVVADLPCGHFEAVECTRDMGVRKAAPLPIAAKRSKQSVFSARSSRTLLPVATSCLPLLDREDVKDDDAVPPKRVVFMYDKDERIHSGSYRANGVLLTVQVFMKAVIVTIPKPRLPVDRLEQDDSFEMAFDYYHPATSSSQRCVIHGRTDLREVVGPDKAALIASATVHELVEHIIEARTSVHFESIVEGTRVVVAFVRDRLYAKHKTTPLQKTLDADATANASKLIDAKPDRGLRLLTKTKTLADDRGGKVIITVFDVRHTRLLQAGNANESALHLRVDGYVCDSSTQLSLSLEAADLAHILDEELLGLLGDGIEDDAEKTRRKQRLAQLVIGHIGVERKRDGTPDRLFLTETSTIGTNHRDDEIQKTRRPVGKTVKHVRHRPIVATVYWLGASGACDGFEIECYDPQTSARAALTLAPSRVGLSVEDSQSSTLFASLSGATAAAFVDHCVSLVHIDAPSEDSALEVTLTAIECTKPHIDVASFNRVWRGFLASVSPGHDLCLVHIGLQTPPAKAADFTAELSSVRLVCCVVALRKGVAASRIVTSEELASVLSPGTWSLDELLRESVARIRVRVLPPPPPQDTDEGGANASPVDSPRASSVVIELSN